MSFYQLNSVCSGYRLMLQLVKNAHYSLSMTKEYLGIFYNAFMIIWEKFMMVVVFWHKVQEFPNSTWYLMHDHTRWKKLDFNKIGTTHLKFQFKAYESVWVMCQSVNRTYNMLTTNVRNEQWHGGIRCNLTILIWKFHLTVSNRII